MKYEWAEEHKHQVTVQFFDNREISRAFIEWLADNFDNFKQYCQEKGLQDIPDIDQRTRVLGTDNTLFFPLSGQLFPETTAEELRASGFEVDENWDK
jgi:hypothetical protein